MPKPQTTKTKQDDDMPPRRVTIQTSQREIRRGERNRMKTDVFGQNIMITKIDGATAGRIKLKQFHSEVQTSNFTVLAIYNNTNFCYLLLH